MNDTSQQLTEPASQEGVKDDKNIVTPYAFGISEELFGKRIASPHRRLFALLVDLLIIAILSSLHAGILATVVTFIFLRTTIKLAKQKKYPRTRIALNLASSILVFFIAFAFFNATRDTPQDTQAITGEAALLTAAAYATWTQCQDVLCKENTANEFSKAFAESSITSEQYHDAVKELIQQDESLSSSQQQRLIFEAQTQFDTNRQSSEINNLSAQSPQQTSSLNDNTDENSQYSVVAWIKGLITDLGLGFGWAAVYFSALTAWQNGSTLGKRLFGIKVVRLDGGVPTLWESFGRYGGYGAGLATGLLGFLQIYWDPNRQAIQDKISETLVLRIDAKS